MGYMTTDFWANYDRIWLEPMYILVTAWNARRRWTTGLRDADGDPGRADLQRRAAERVLQPVSGRSSTSRSRPAPRPRSTPRRAQLFDAGLVMHPGPNRFCARSRPAGVSTLPSTRRDPCSTRPGRTSTDATCSTALDCAAAGQVVASSQRLTGWLDGRPITYLDFGTDNFTADADRVSRTCRCSCSAARRRRQADDPLGAPNVAGVAPLFSGVPAAGERRATGRTSARSGVCTSYAAAGSAGRSARPTRPPRS